MRRAKPATPSRRLLVALAGAALVAVPVTACAPPTRVVTVEIRDMAFGPIPSDLAVGDAIEWVNADIFQHSATARNGAFDVDLAPKARARTVLTTPGRINFYCRYHPGMTGQIAVGR